MIEKVSLFSTNKERLAAVLVVAALLSLSLFQKFLTYQKLTKSRYYHTNAKVLGQYKKKDRWVLKLKTPHFSFYTTSKEDLADLRDRDVEVMLIRTKRTIDFFDFLKGFYAFSYIKRVLPKDRRYKLKEYIASQHEELGAKELFGALFLATSISKEVRDQLSALGLSHLVALSGFHLGIILATISFLFYWIAFPLWQRYLPFLHLKRFAVYSAFGVALGYLFFVGMVPSLVRAFVLSLVGFFLYERHIKLLSFELLFWVAALILALFPEFFFSVGFWFSVAGVFCIYLFLHHFDHYPWWIKIVLFNFWVYFLMIPVVHLVFDTFSLWQLLSPIVSMLFAVFYPIAILLHFVGFGGLLDSLVDFLDMSFTPIHFKTPLWFFLPFVAMLIGSIYKHRLIFAALLFEIAWLVHEIA